MNGKQELTYADRARHRLAAITICLALMAPAGAAAELPDPVRFAVTVQSGDVATVEGWLKAGLPPDFSADRIGTGLMLAAWEGNIDMMTLFAAHGADINAKNANGEQPLMHAAWNGHLQAVRWLLDRGALINRQGLEWSALHYAVFAGHRDVVNTLIARGADINARSTNGASPLMMASREGHDELAQLLVNLGASTALKNDWGDDALTWAMRNGNPQIARMVAAPERFAEAARAPREQFGAPTRSLPPPLRLASIMKAIRAAEAEGRPTLALQEQYLAAVRELRAARAAAEARAQSEQGAPAGLEIRAQRGAPGREQAVLIYEPREPGSAPLPAPLEAAPGAAGP